ncbi:hypothetical protein PIB30_013539 [Stylosanthes scabra]|uniref:RNase H type-1 domain-containing protein n=1 Tax=Stylosanthes scabra TaxID=79078 RepID=A0ABU6R642_9FABA|nr:hypothetical protein [Stylosanthes scabra]
MLAKYLRSNFKWDFPSTHNSSYLWKSIVKAASWLRDGYTWCIGSLEQSFWFDSWNPHGILAEKIELLIQNSCKDFQRAFDSQSASDITTLEQRSSNSVADFLAKNAARRNINHMEWFDPPNEIEMLLRKDQAMSFAT